MPASTTNPKTFNLLQHFCSCGQISHKSNNSWGSCRDMVSLGFRDGGVWITVGDYPFLYPHPSLFLCLSLSIHPSPQISSSRGSARSPSGHITDIWTATGELTGDSADERVEEKQKEETNRNIGALTPKVNFLIVKSSKCLANVWTLLVCIFFCVMLEHLSLFLLHRQLAAPGRHVTHTSTFSLPSSWSPSVWPNLPTPSTHYNECVCISKLDRKKYAQGKVVLTFTVAVYIFAFCLTL